jgi:hypothetical protein
MENKAIFVSKILIFRQFLGEETHIVGAAGETHAGYQD